MSRVLTSWRALMIAALVIAALVIVAIRAALTEPFGLLDDEAYYWFWSHALSLSYLDNAPGAGWYLLPWRWSVGEAAWQIRLYANLMTLATAWALWRLVRQLFPRVRIEAAWLLLSAPLLLVSGLIWVHDVPLALCLTLASWQLVRALQGSPSAWLYAGLFMALALLAKLTALLYLGLAALWFLLDPAGRKALRGWQIWIGLGIALLGLLPSLLWNAQHDWITFRFQGAHVFAADARRWTAEPLMALLLYYGVMAGLPLLVSFKLALHRIDWKPERRALMAMAAGSSLLFLVIAAYKTFLVNWAALSVLLLIALAAGELAQRSRAWQITQALQSLLLLLLLAVLFHSPASVERLVNLRSAYLWPELRSEIDARLAELPADTLLAGNRYQEAAQLAYLYRDRWEHLPGGHAVPALGLAHRPSHFDTLWPEQDYEGRDFLLLLPEKMSPESLAPYFCTLETLPPLIGVWRQRELQRWHLVHAVDLVGRHHGETPATRAC